MSTVLIILLSSFIFFFECHCEVIVDLSNYSWTLSQDSLGLKVSNITLPSGVFSDLIKENVLPSDKNIYYRFNDQEYRWISKRNWSYSVDINNIHHPKSKFKYVYLNLKGIDTISEIKWNNKSLGKTFNMFKEYYFNIENYNFNGRNELQILFYSPVAYGRSMAEAYYSKQGYRILPECPPPEYGGECHINFLRKMQSSYGWDWGPAFPSMGIWKPAYLILTNEISKIDCVKWETELKDGVWKATVQVVILSKSTFVAGNITTNIPELEFSHLQTVKGQTIPSMHKGIRELKANISLEFNEKSVEKWWPNGLGKQKLYTLRVGFNFKLFKEVKIAFRTIELRQKSPIPSTTSKGLTFMFVINGQKMFAKGSNWIPTHVLPEKMKNEHVTHLLESAQKTGMNMLRVWGGGIYESDHFYNTADEKGILIWQDLMFACSLYPSNEEFLNIVNDEIVQQVRRLQHHTSIAIWAGNNENEAVLSGNWYGSDSNFKAYRKDYDALYSQTIGKLIKLEDSSRAFLTSSPSNGDGPSSLENQSISPYDPLYGDTHFYDYYSKFWNPSSYPSTRFASEFGFQSISSLEDLLEVSDPYIDLIDIDSKFFFSRQHHPSGFIQLRSQIESYLGLKESQLKSREGVERFIYLSQIYQAVGLKVQIEHYRRNAFIFDNSTGKGLTMGALYWQLNEIWPGVSWSTINFGGTWKIGHFFVKKAFTSPLISPVLEENRIQLHMLDETDTVRLTEGIIKVRVQRWDSFDYYQHQIPVKKSGHEIKTLDLNNLLKAGNCSESGILRLNYCYIRFNLVQDKKILSSNDIYEPPKEIIGLKRDTKILITSIKVNPTDLKQIEIILTTDAPAIFVHLSTKGFKGEFSDNGFFFMEKEITIIYTGYERIANLIEFKKSLRINYYINL